MCLRLFRHKSRSRSVTINVFDGGFRHFRIGKWLIWTASILLIVNTMWLAWIQFSPQKPIPDSRRLALAYRGAESIREDLRIHRGDYRTIAFLPFSGDMTDTVSDAVRTSIRSSGTLELCDQTLSDKVRVFLGFRQYSSNNQKEAQQLGRHKGTDLVLYGCVKQYEVVECKAYLQIDYSLLETQSGTVIWSGEYDSKAHSESKIPELLDNLLEKTSDISSLNRFFGWTLIVLLLPVFTIQFLMLMAERHSNYVNAFVLGGYTLVDILLAWILLCPNFPSTWHVVFFIVLCISAFIYNIRLMTFACHRSDTF